MGCRRGGITQLPRTDSVLPVERIRVAVLVGGRSSEHEISCISGRSIVRALDPQRYAVHVVGIRRDGTWVASPARDLTLLDEFGPLPRVSDHARAIPIEEALRADVVIPVLHGPWGEDGTVQGLLESFDMPFVGSGTLASAVAMDKGFMKAMLAAAGLDVGRFVAFSDRRWRDDRAGVLSEVADLGLPVFVKPARAGSSMGISKASTADEVEAAVESAREHDPRVIVEAAVEGAREIECGVLVDDEGRPSASRCAEIVVNAEHEFYDFAAKYLDDSATLIVPAELDDVTERAMQDIAVRAFDALACEGLARVDFFLRPDGSIVVNEVNTMPGFTSISMYPRMWEASGVDYATLVDRLVQDALRKGTGLR